MATMDPLRAYETLRSKFDEAAAKTIVEAVVQLTSPPLSDLATKTDLHTEILATKSDLRAEILATRSDLQAEIQAAKADLRTEILATRADLQAEIQAVKADFLGKLHTTTLAIIGANLTAIAVATGILLKSLGH